MSTETELNQLTADALEQRRQALDMRASLVGDALYIDARKKLLTWGGSALAAASAALGVVAYFGFNDFVTNRAISAVDPAISKVETSATKFEIISENLREEFDRINVALLDAETQLSELRDQTESVQNLAERSRYLTDDEVEDRFKFMLFAVRATSFLCNEQSADEFKTDIHLYFDTEFQTGAGKSYRSFPLVGAQRLFGINVDNNGWPIGGMDCNQNKGVLDQTDNRTPAFADIRDMPKLSGFRLESKLVQKADGTQALSDVEVGQFESKWRDVQSAYVLLEIGATNNLFLRNPLPFQEDGWMDDDDEWFALDPIQFVNETNDTGEIRRIALLPLRQPMPLTALLD